MPSWIDPATIPIAPGDPVASTALLGAITGDLSYLFANGTNLADLAGAPLIANNSFEQDANGTDGSLMSAWTWVAGTGGTGTVVNTDQNHGAKSFKMVQDTIVGHTAGTLTMSGFMVVSPSLAYAVRFMLKCSRADVKNQVIINWYAADQTFLSSTTVKTIANGSSPTSWTVYNSPRTSLLIPPSNAFFAKIQLQGGQDTVTPPGASTNIFWDGIQIVALPSFSTSAAAYASSTNVNVPSGVFQAIIEGYGARATPTGVTIAGAYRYGGHFKAVISVEPGDVIAITISGGTVTIVAAGLTYTAVAATATTEGTATGPGADLLGASVRAAAAAVVIM